VSEDLVSAAPAEAQDAFQGPPQGATGEPVVLARVSPASGPTSGHAVISIARWWRAAASTR